MFTIIKEMLQDILAPSELKWIFPLLSEAQNANILCFIVDMLLPLSRMRWECYHEWWVGEDLVGRDRGLCYSNIPVFAQSFWGNPRNFWFGEVPSCASPLQQTVQLSQKPKSSLNK